MDSITQEMGFFDTAEYYDLLKQIPLETPEQIARYRLWETHDGTRAGLLNLLDETERDTVCEKV